MYGTLPRSFTGPEIASQRSRRRRILDVRHLNQYATFRLSPSEVGLVMPRHLEDYGSHQDLMLDEETLRATRFNSTRLSMSVEESSEDYESSSSEEKSRSIPMVQRPPPPPPRRRPPPDSEAPTLSPSPDHFVPTLSPNSNHSEEKVRSLPSTSVYKPLPPLPGQDNDDTSPSSDDSSGTPRSLRTSESPSCSSSSKKLSVTFCETEVVAGEMSKGANLFRSMFQKKAVVPKNVAPAITSRLRNSPERQTSLTVTPTPILIPRPMSSNDRRHLPLAKRLSNKLKEPFANKNC